MVNAQNILKVADAIEQHSIPGLGFNMDYLKTAGRWAHQVDHLGVADCGSVACIAGWASTVLTHDIGFSVAAKALGLDGETADQLFYATNHPKAHRGEYGPLSTIEADQAIRTLRHLASTGEVDWTV